MDSIKKISKIFALTIILSIITLGSRLLLKDKWSIKDARADVPTDSTSTEGTGGTDPGSSSSCAVCTDDDLED